MHYISLTILFYYNIKLDVEDFMGWNRVWANSELIHIQAIYTLNVLENKKGLLHVH